MYQIRNRNFVMDGHTIKCPSMTKTVLQQIYRVIRPNIHRNVYGEISPHQITSHWSQEQCGHSEKAFQHLHPIEK